MGKAGRKAARRQARLEHKAEEAQQHRRRRQTRTLVAAAVVLVVVAGGGWALWSALRPEPTASGPSQPGAPSPAGTPRPQIVDGPDQGRDHVGPGVPHPAYNSNPPTSGWHYASTAPWGFHNTDLPDELIIHNLEHGGIWITFKDATDAEVVDALVALAREYRTKVVVTHRPRNDRRIALAAWGHLMTLDRFDRGAIVDFINRFKNKGPEFVPD
jgi:hypothetical protein